MFLTDATIERMLSTTSLSGFQESVTLGSWNRSDDTLLIFPFKKKPNLTPLGYDLTVGQHYLSMTQKTRFTLAPQAPLVIQPRDTVLISTEEYIGLPKNRSLLGLIESKVSLVSKGLSPISTTLDPDWEGHLLVAVTNHQTDPITLMRGEAFCTAMFATTTERATQSCNRPPGRDDIIRETLEKWLQDAKQAELTLFQQLLLPIIQIAIVIVAGVIGLVVFGPTEGFSGVIAIGVAIAVIIPPAAQVILQRIRRK